MSQHPRAREVAKQTVQWAFAQSLVNNDTEILRAQNIRVGDLAAYAFPNQPEPVVQIGADLILWLFLFDDAIGEAPPNMLSTEHEQIIRSYVDTLQSRSLPEDCTPFHAALLDIIYRAIGLGATEEWLDRFNNDMQGYFLGCIDELPYRRLKIFPTVDAYRNIRAQTVGTSAVFAVIELGRNGVVPSEEMKKPEVINARRIAALLTAWVNDVYSYPKEMVAGDPLNLVAAVSNQYGLDTEAALSEAATIYNKDLYELEGVVHNIMVSSCSKALGNYLEGLLDWVHGNRVWTKMCGRYF